MDGIELDDDQKELVRKTAQNHEEKTQEKVESGYWGE